MTRRLRLLHHARPRSRPRSRTARGSRAIAYRIGTFATFRKAILDELSRTPELAGLTRARQRRLHDHGDRAVGGRRRRADVLPGAHRQRGVPAHRDPARLGPAPGAPHRLRAGAGRRGHDAARVHARRRRDGAHPGRHARRRACPARARSRRSSRRSQRSRPTRALNRLRALPAPRPARRRPAPEPPPRSSRPDAEALAAAATLAAGRPRDRSTRPTRARDADGARRRSRATTC